MPCNSIRTCRIALAEAAYAALLQSGTAHQAIANWLSEHLKHQVSFDVRSISVVNAAHREVKRVEGVVFKLGKHTAYLAEGGLTVRGTRSKWLDEELRTFLPAIAKIAQSQELEASVRSLGTVEAEGTNQYGQLVLLLNV